MFVHNNKGMTLLEVLLSITILSIFAITLSYFLANGMRANDISQQRLDALIIAQNCLEMTKVDLHSPCMLESYNTNFVDTGMLTGKTAFTNGIQYEVRREISGGNLKEVVVTVSDLTGTDIQIATKLFRP